MASSSILYSYENYNFYLYNGKSGEGNVVGLTVALQQGTHWVYSVLHL